MFSHITAAVSAMEGVNSDVTAINATKVYDLSECLDTTGIIEKCGIRSVTGSCNVSGNTFKLHNNVAVRSYIPTNTTFNDFTTTVITPPGEIVHIGVNVLYSEKVLCVSHERNHSLLNNMLLPALTHGITSDSSTRLRYAVGDYTTVPYVNKHSRSVRHSTPNIHSRHTENSRHSGFHCIASADKSYNWDSA